jgi:hypothetical protein
VRKQWFGDSRDYVKWSCLRQEATHEYIVIYGAMLRPDGFEDDNLDEAVVNFFDQQKDFRALGKLFPQGFKVFERIYETNSAEGYFSELQLLIAKTKPEGKILVFLDPDTGIEPRRNSKNEHLRIVDICRVCESLSGGDKLVIYQHALRTSNWINTFSSKLEEEVARVTGSKLGEPFHARGVAKDVCFFTLTKN